MTAPTTPATPLPRCNGLCLQGRSPCTCRPHEQTNQLIRQAAAKAEQRFVDAAPVSAFAGLAS